MAATDQPLIRNTDNAPVPQYYSPANDKYEALEGRGGAHKVIIDKSVIILPADIQAVKRVHVYKNRDPLALNATLTGEGIECINFIRAVGFAYSDQAGTLWLDQSDDGVTWYWFQSKAVTANTTAIFDFPCIARYVRARYINGAAAQTLFAVSLYLSPQ